MRQMKVAHLIPRLYIGGAERVLLDLCLHGREQQKVVTAQDGPMRAVFEQHGVEVQVGENRGQLVSLLSEADVVNFHWIGCRPDLFSVVLATGRPMVCSMQWISVLPELPGLVICASRHIYDLQEPNRERRVLITNGIDTTRFQPRAPRAGPVQMIRVCRPAKCAEYFWPAVFQVLAACPEAELTVVGGPAYEAGRIHSLGYRLDVDQLLQRSDIFVYTPRPGEGAFDLVVLEAMASGVPCVLSDVACVNEAVEDQVTGLLTPFEDVPAFAEGILRLIREADLREAMGQRAAQAAREGFDVRDRMPLYSAAYARAANEAPPRSESQRCQQNLLQWLVHG